MFIRIKNALLSLEDVRSVEAGTRNSANIFEPERAKSALIIRFSNVEDPLYICCDSEEERDDIFEELTDRIEAEEI